MGYVDLYEAAHDEEYNSMGIHRFRQEERLTKLMKKGYCISCGMYGHTLASHYIIKGIEEND